MKFLEYYNLLQFFVTPSLREIITRGVHRTTPNIVRTEKDIEIQFVASFTVSRGILHSRKQDMGLRKLKTKNS